MELIKYFNDSINNLTDELYMCQQLFYLYNEKDNHSCKKVIIHRLTEVCKIYNHTLIDFYIFNYFNLNLSYDKRIDFEHVIELNYSMYHNYGQILSDLAVSQKKITFDNMFSSKILLKYGNLYEYLKTSNIRNLNNDFYINYFRAWINYEYISKPLETKKSFLTKLKNKIFNKEGEK